MNKIIMTAPNLKERAEAVIKELETKDVEVSDLELLFYIAKNYPDTAFVRYDNGGYTTDYDSGIMLTTEELGLDPRCDKQAVWFKEAGGNGLEELAKELNELDIDNMCSREIAAYILDNYEIKKKPVDGV
jgi:hypothetical protein